jgi:hypothetical protein
LLRSGDRLDPDYIPRCLDILSQHPQAGYVGSWKWIGNGKRMRLQTHPFSAMLELAPFETESPLHRCVMRTRAGQLLIDLFDPRAESFGELAYLWKLEDSQTFGLQIPAPLIWQHAEPIGARRSSERSYLLMHDSSPTRNRRLSRYLGMLANGYPQPLLPLQATWARRYHLQLSLDKKMPVFSGTGFRSRLLDLLNRSGPMGRGVLAIIAWLREKTS